MVRTLKKSRKPIWWSLAGIACVLISTGLALRPWPAGRSLPANRHYQNLPDVFDQVLQEARAKAQAIGSGPAELRKLALLYQANRLDPEARACYQLIAATPEGLAPRDHYYLADLALSEGNLEEAQNELRAVLASTPGYLPARLTLADVLFKSGQDDQAGKEYSTILSMEANQPQAMFGLARIELQRGQDDAAVARLEDLMASHPESTSGAALFAQVLDRRGEADRAVAMTQWSRQRPEPIPADPWMSAMLAECYDPQRLALRFEDYFKTGQVDEAVPFLHRVEELDPQSSVPPLLRGWSQAQTHHDLEAVQEYRLALTKGGDPEKICPYLVQSLLTVGNVAEAARLMAEYYAKMPDSIPILTSYADVAVRQGDEKMARVLLSKVLEREPYLYAANVSLGKIFWASGERDEAAKCLRRIATFYAKDVASRALLGEYYLAKSDPFAAIGPLEQAIAQAPGSESVTRSLRTMLEAAYLQGGKTEMGRGHLEDAANYFDKASRLAPAEPTGFAFLADACVQLKQYRRSAAALEKLASLQPDNPTVYLSLGDVRYQDGEAEQARRDWQKARQLTAPGDDALRHALDQRLNGPISAETFK